ncbi:C-C chemokine receptor type 1 [Amia ocellicauda]|uniref:C-C chemokine receptor type 1 n=1 Tax=Amia ocellicauda TaxID=2972642 RepID=UPI003463A56E
MSMTSWINTSEYEDYSEMDGYLDSAPCLYEKHGSSFLPQLYSLFVVVGVIGNALVLWVLLLRVKLRSMTDVCLLNLAIADLLFVFSLPFLAHYARDEWIFGDAMCKIILGSYHIAFYSGIFFITLMSIDRYLAIVHAVYALKARTPLYGAIASTVIWIVSFLASFPEIIHNAVKNENDKTCSPQYTTTEQSKNLRVFGIIKMNVLGLLIPLSIMVFCYAMIIRRLLTCRSSKKQTIRLVVLVVIVFFFCWTPYNIAAFFKAMEITGIYSGCESSKRIQLSLQITEAVAYSHSCLNPIVYVFVGEKFKRHLFKQLNHFPCVNYNKLTTNVTPTAHSADIQPTKMSDNSMIYL